MPNKTCNAESQPLGQKRQSVAFRFTLRYEAKSSK